MSMEKEEIDFLREKETLYGGKITFRSFSAWFCSSDGILREHGVILYMINNIVHFEDFEHVNTILGYPLPKTRYEKEHPYEKWESEFKCEDVVDCYKVRHSSAKEVMEGKKKAPLKTVSSFSGFFQKTVLQVLLKDGKAYYFELINTKEFIDALKR